MSSHHNSLRWRSGVNLVVIAAALVAITVITNAYSFNLMLRNFRQSLSSTAQIYTEQISGKVDKINSGSLELVSLAASSQNYYTSSPLGRYLTQQDILTRLQNRLEQILVDHRGDLGGDSRRAGPQLPIKLLQGQLPLILKMAVAVLSQVEMHGDDLYIQFLNSRMGQIQRRVGEQLVGAHSRQSSSLKIHGYIRQTDGPNYLF